MKLKIAYIIFLSIGLIGCHKEPATQQASVNAKVALKSIHLEAKSNKVAPKDTESITVAKVITTAPSKIEEPVQISQEIHKPRQTKNTARAKPPVIDLWQPNEAQIARGNDLILGLSSEIARAPTPYEMQKRLQTHMGLSKTQAIKVITALGKSLDENQYLTAP